MTVPTKRMKRTIKDGFEPTDPFHTSWGVWSVTSSGMIVDLGQLAKLKMKHLLDQEHDHRLVQPSRQIVFQFKFKHLTKIRLGDILKRTTIPRRQRRGPCVTGPTEYVGLHLQLGHAIRFTQCIALSVLGRLQPGQQSTHASRHLIIVGFEQLACPPHVAKQGPARVVVPGADRRQHIKRCDLSLGLGAECNTSSREHATPAAVLHGHHRLETPNLFFIFQQLQNAQHAAATPPNRIQRNGDREESDGQPAIRVGVDVIRDHFGQLDVGPGLSGTSSRSRSSNNVAVSCRRTAAAA